MPTRQARQSGFGQACLAWLALVRFPNLFTAMADPLAGVLIAKAGPVPALQVFTLMAASAALYAAGCVLNDIRDRSVDLAERPTRPLPSGRVGLAEAVGGAVLLLALGLSTARIAGPGPFSVAIALASCIFVYNFLVKEHDVLGPVAMGGCRGLNLLLGMSAGEAHGLVLIFPLVTVCYILAITSMSREEAVDGTPAPSLIAAVAAITTLFLPAVLLATRRFMDAGVPVYLVFAAVAGLAFRRGLTARRPAEVGRAVGSLILLLPLLDGFYVAAVRGLLPAAAVCGLMFPAGYLARRFYVT